MERVLRFRDYQHEEDRVTRLHSGGGGGHQTDSGIEQNNDYEDESDEEEKETNGLSRKAKKEIEKRRRRRAKKKGKSSSSSSTTAPSPPPAPVRKESSKTSEKKKKKKYDSDDDDDETTDENIEIEYVPEDLPVKRGDGYYTHFAKIFENFKLDPNGDENMEYHYNKYGKKVLGPKVIQPRDKTNLDENEDDDDEEKEKNNADKKKKDPDEDEQNKKKSKKQIKRETRLSVAQLKQLVIRPDVVEMFDVTAKDPKLLVHLKVSLFFNAKELVC